MTSSQPIQVLAMLSDDESSNTLRKFLSGVQGISLAAEAKYEAEVLQKVKHGHFDIVLLDYSSSWEQLRGRRLYDRS